MRRAPSEIPTTSVVNGVTRSYLTTIGKGYEPQEPVPLIVAFHGRTNSNSMVRQYYKLDRVTQGEAIIIYPSGLPE
jgi:poly(3-hydroxybutyrate) depolymerase